MSNDSFFFFTVRTRSTSPVWLRTLVVNWVFLFRSLDYLGGRRKGLIIFTTMELAQWYVSLNHCYGTIYRHRKQNIEKTNRFGKKIFYKRKFFFNIYSLFFPETRDLTHPPSPFLTTLGHDLTPDILLCLCTRMGRIFKVVSLSRFETSRVQRKKSTNPAPSPFS